VDFAVRVSDVVVRGSMDLLVRDGQHATVLDYKTGTKWDAVEGRYRAQAEIYAFALLTAGMRSVEVRFVHVEAACEQEVFRFVPEDAHAIRARLEEVLERMNAGAFPRLSAFSERYCTDCPVSGSLCPVVHPGRKRGCERR
jgi:RecB family exonuclease